MLRKDVLCIFLCVFIRFCEGATPQFDYFNPGVSIDEGSPPGTLLIQVHASVLGGGVVTYSLESNAQDWFVVNSTGHITVSRTLDREDPNLSGQLNFYVYASDGNPSERTEKRIYCTINDINDNPPVFENTPYKVNITEDTQVGVSVFQTEATDADGRLNGYGEVVSRIVGGNEEDKFEINGGTGVVTVKTALDYETTTIYRLNITAADLKGNGTVTWTELVINILDVVDQQLLFSRGLYEASIDKESRPGTIFKTVHAGNLDSVSASITYDIFPATDPDGLFEIDSVTGVCSLAKTLDSGTYCFIVTAKTTHHSPGFAQVKLTVGSLVNTSYETSVLENEANVTIFDLSVLSGHFNLSGAQFYIAYGAPDAIFVVDVAAHAIKVGAKPLDREESEQRSLVIEVKQNGTNIGYAKLIVNVLDINDNTPAFKEPAPYSESIREDIDLGTELFVVQAFDGDRDENGTITYRIQSGNEQGLFSLDNLTGVLSLAKSLDRETADRHVLTLRATDGGDPSRENSTQLVIHVTDFNDNAPIIQPQILHVNVSENANPGTFVTQVNATDADSSENGNVLYGILEGGDDKFVIENTSGIIRVKSGLDRETKSQYKMAIKAQDNGKTPQQLYSVGFVTATILDVNDNSPVFQPQTYIAGAFQDAQHRHILVTVTAMDADARSNGDVLYELKTGGEGLFFVESQTGHVTAAVSLRDKEGTKYTLNISAKDAGYPTRRSNVNAIVDIYIFREDNVVLLEAGIPPINITKNIEEFLSVLGNVTGGRPFIKYMEPSGDGTLVKFFVVKDNEEMGSDEVLSALNSNKELLESVHSKWNIQSYVRQSEPSVGARTSEASGLSATVGALICLAVMIGVGGVIMIIILIRKRRISARLQRRRSSRVTFNDKPLYIDPVESSSIPVAQNGSASRESVEDNTTEAHESFIDIPNDNSNSPEGSVDDRYEYMNYAYATEGEEPLNFSSFQPPPPPSSPPPPPPGDSEDEDEDEDEEPLDHVLDAFEASDQDHSDESPGEESIADSVNSTAQLVGAANVSVETCTTEL